MIGTPLRRSRFSVAVDGCNALRARRESILPAVIPSRAANSLAASRTSSSISRVVRMHQMLYHLMIHVKFVSEAALGPDTGWKPMLLCPSQRVCGHRFLTRDL